MQSITEIPAPATGIMVTGIARSRVVALGGIVVLAEHRAKRNWLLNSSP